MGIKKIINDLVANKRVYIVIQLMKSNSYTTFLMSDMELCWLACIISDNYLLK